MAHETGSATDPIDLLDKLRLFCIAQASITFNEYRTEGAAPGQLLSVSFNGGFYSIGFQVHATDSEEGYALTQATGWNAATAWGSQPDETAATSNKRCMVNGLLQDGAISTYHFTYHVGGVVMVSLLTQTGAWRHFCFGDIEKYGTYTGGSIVLGHYISVTLTETVYFGMRSPSVFTAQRAGWLRIDDGATVIMRKLSIANAHEGARVSTNAYASILPRGRIFGTAPSTPTQASSLVPIAFAVPIASGSSKFSPVGVLRDVRFVNMQLLDNEQVFDTDWLAFSQGIKNDPDEVTVEENNGFIGIAVKVL